MKKLLALLLALGWAPPAIAASPGLAPAGMVYTGPASGSASVPAFRALTDVYSSSMGNAAGRGMAVRVRSEAELAALSVATTPQVLRYDFYPGVGAPPVLYVGQAAACSSPDNGAQVTSADSGCYIAHFSNGGLDPKDWGATGSANTATCSSASNTTLTCSGGVADFQAGMPVAVLGVGPSSTASAPTLAVAAVNGSGTTYFYTVAPIDSSMGVGAALTPVSVSGGPDLGTAQDMNVGLTGDTHGNTTVDNLKIGGVACTAATCPLGVGGHIKATANFAPGTSISAINSATSITISTPANTTAAGIPVNPSSPAGGVYNQLTVTGTAPSYAVYEGTSATLSAMTCIGVHTNLTAVNGGLWNDFGASHATGCPSWIPAVPSASAMGETLLTTVATASGSTITLANTAAKTLGSTTVVHNDQPALAAALVYGDHLSLSCGTYNIFAGLVETNGAGVKGAGCSTIAGWGAGFDDLTFSGTADSAAVSSTTFDDTQKASGFYLTSSGGERQLVADDLSTINSCNGIQLNNTLEPRFSSLGSPSTSAARVRCDVALYEWQGATGGAVVAPSFNNVQMGNSATSTNAYGILIDGNANSSVFTNLAMQDFPRGALVMQNTVGASKGPNNLNATQLQINVESGPPIVISAGGGSHTFSHLFLQGQPGDGTPCVNLTTTNAGTVTFTSGSQIFGCDDNGITNASLEALNVGDGSTEIYSNNMLDSTFDKIRLSSTAGPAVIRLAAGDSFAGNTNNVTTERCGVSIESGYGTNVSLPIGSPLADVTTAGPGVQAPVCDSSGTYGLVRVDGQFNSPTWETNSAGGTLTVSEMLGNQNGTTPAIYISVTTGTPATWTTPTATALLAAVQNANTSQKFTFNLYNQGHAVVTIAGGTGVTITGTATTANVSGPHLFTCWFTNTGTPAMTCNG